MPLLGALGLLATRWQTHLLDGLCHNRLHGHAGLLETVPQTCHLRPWDYTRKAFDPAALSVAKLLFEAADQTKQMLGVGPSSLGYDAIPGLFAFSFFDPAGFPCSR